MAVSHHLGYYRTGNSAIRSPTSKTLAQNETWSRSDAPFATYSPLNYTVTLKLGFGVTKVIESCTMRSADPENLILEPNITSIGKAVAKLWPVCISKMAVSRHLGFYRTANIAIQSADLENPSLESNMEWIGCTVFEIFAFKLHRDLETGVRGHSRSS